MFTLFILEVLMILKQSIHKKSIIFEPLLIKEIMSTYTF